MKILVIFCVLLAGNYSVAKSVRCGASYNGQSIQLDKTYLGDYAISLRDEYFDIADVIIKASRPERVAFHLALFTSTSALEVLFSAPEKLSTEQVAAIKKLARPKIVKSWYDLTKQDFAHLELVMDGRELSASCILE